MKDRGGKDYLPVWQRISNEYAATAIDRDIGHTRQIGWLSPSRQADKALGLSGRQRVKLRKRLRRALSP